MILFIVVFLLLLLVILYFISILIHKLLKRIVNEKIALIGVLFFWGIIIYNFYIAIYPNDEFYENEFKTITLTELPKSAEIVNSTASYPDFQGDYCSSAEIKLSKEDFDSLLKKIINDDNFLKNNEILNSEETMSIMYETKTNDLSHKFIRIDKQNLDLHLNINFHNDNRTVFINICKI
jgi:hypothetical protein